MSEAYGEWLERNDHPLLNTVILTTIFKHLKGNDLKECRLVCKTWNKSTIPYTRKAFIATIYGRPSTKHPRQARNRRVGNFVEVFRSNELGIPFQRFRLGSFCTTDGIGQEFLQLCGDVVKEIEFVRKPDNLIEDLSALLKSTPNLETFKIPKNICSRSGDVVKLFPGPEDSKPKLTFLKNLEVCLDNREKRNEFCPTFLEEFITAAENITNVHLWDSVLHNAEGEEVNNGGGNIEVLSLIEKLGRESSIQELKLSHEMSDDSEYFELLRKMTVKPDGLKLKRFRYQPTSFDQANHKLPQLISLFKDTLQHLKLKGNKSARFTEFLKMPHLVRLSIDLSHNFSSKFVNLNEIFPALKELELFEHNFMPHCNFAEFFPESEPCPQMSTFISHIVLNIDPFNQMLTIFPNLTNLSLLVIGDGEQILRQICTQMNQLEYLHVGGRLQAMESVDSVLTGISTEALEEIKDIVDNLEKMSTELERREMITALRDQHSQLPSIGNLTHLKSLSLYLIVNENADGDGRSCLTDMTGYMGLYSMKNLQEIILQNCELTKTCCEILTKELRLQSWTFTTSDEGNIIPPKAN